MTPVLRQQGLFQRDVLRALWRTAVELAEVFGRAHGTSEVDKGLRAALGLLQYDDRTWWFDSFDVERPFGPVQP